MNTDRFARAHLDPVLSSPQSYDCVVTIKVANGDYYELRSIDRYHAEIKLHEFARHNRLILTECAGFSNGGRAVRSDSGSMPVGQVSPIAAARSPARSPIRSHYKGGRQC